MRSANMLQSDDALVEEGLAAYGAGKEEEAIALWQRALEYNCGNVAAREYLEAAGVGVPHLADVVDLHPSATPPELAQPVNPVALSSDARAEILAAVEGREFEGALELLYRARASYPGDTSLSLSVHHIKRKLVQRYERRVGDMDAVAARSFARGESERSDAELTVLGLVDGIASFGDVVRISALGRFETLRALCQLLDDEVVGVADQPRSRSRPNLPAARPVRRPPPSVGSMKAVGVLAPPPPNEVAPGSARNETLYSIQQPESLHAAEPAKDNYDRAYAGATDAYLRRDYTEAERGFERCLIERPDDSLALHNLERLRARLEQQQ